MAVFGSYSDINEDEGKTDFLRLLYHANRTGQMMVVRKDPSTGKVVQESTCDLSDLEAIENDGRNTYVSINTFAGRKRKSDHCFALGALFIDLDIHDSNEEVRESVKSLTREVLEEAFKSGRLSEPTMITDSGRGFGLYYVLKRSIAAQCDTNELQVQLFRKTRQLLFEKVRSVVEDHQISLKVDAAVLSDAQVARLPDTYNRKAGKNCELIAASGRFFELSEIINENRLWEKSASGKTNEGKKHSAKCISHEVFAERRFPFFANRMEAFEKLQDLRGSDCTDSCRELMCFIAYSALVQLDSGTAAKKLYAFNNRFEEPLDHKELDHIIAGAAANVTKDGCGFYKLPNSYVKRVLDISEEEMKLIGFGTSWKKEEAKLRVAARKAERNAFVCACLSSEEKPTYQAVAEKTGVSLRTVRRIAKKFGLNRHPVKPDVKRAKNCTESVCVEVPEGEGAVCALLGALLKIVPATEAEHRILRKTAREARKILSGTPDRPLSSELTGWIEKMIDSDSDHIDPDDALALAEMLGSEVIAHPVYIDENEMSRLMSGRNVFVTGLAGSGKSTLVSEYIKRCEDAGKTVYRLASTGAAAYLMKGRTVHSAFHLDGVTGPEAPVRLDQIDAIADADVLVIDEIGMLRIDTFEQVMRIVGAVRTAYRKTIQAVVTGDFCQIAPVITEDERPAFEARYPEIEGYAFESPMWSECGFDVEPIVLTKIRRQTDKAFQEALLRMSFGDSTPVKQLNRRLAIDPSISDESATYLCSYRKDVDRINAEFIDRHKADSTFRIFKGTGYTDGVTQLVPEEVPAYVGMPVMTVLNTSAFANGTRGYVCATNVNGISMITQDGRVIRVPICTLRGSDGGAVRQLPVVPAYAMTVHKAQGQSLDKVVLDPRSFAPGQLYTALSRVCDPKKLVLTRPIREDALIVSDAAVAFELDLLKGTKVATRPESSGLSA